MLLKQNEQLHFIKTKTINYLGEQEKLISEIFALVDGLDEPTSKYIYEEMQKILKEEEEKSKRFEALKAEIMKLKGKIFPVKINIRWIRTGSSILKNHV